MSAGKPFVQSSEGLVWSANSTLLVEAGTVDGVLHVPMNPYLVGVLSVISIFGGALLGMRLQYLLPDHHLSKETQDLVKLCAGIVATLTALVLGLLVSSAKSSFDAINTGIVQASANIIFLDRTLARYGPETGPVREQLRCTVASDINAVWPDEKIGEPGLQAVERKNAMESVQDKLNAIEPDTDAHRGMFSQAQQISASLAQSRWLMIEETHNILPHPLVIILVFWLTLLFISFGLFAPRNMTAITVMFVGACAISVAIYLVLELNHPFDGIVRVSSMPWRNALQHLGR